MDEKLKAAKGELSEEDIAAEAITNAQLNQVSGGTEEFPPANPESSDGTEDGMKFVWLKSE